MKKHITLLIALFIFFSVNLAAQELSGAQIREITKQAYIYGFPIVEGYKTFYKQALDKGGLDYKAGINEIGHSRNVASPRDAGFVTPNSDTPYSYAWMDLRAEPIVITMPKIEKDRYYSVQLIDLQTFNFSYLGTRSYGNDGGNFLIVGPNWNGSKPKGIKEIIKSETEIVYGLFRTQLKNSSELRKVNQIQDQYKVRTLSKFLNPNSNTSSSQVAWMKPKEGMTENLSIFSYLNFLMQFIPTHPSEKDLIEKFSKIGVGAGKTFEEQKLPASIRKEMEAGIADVWQKDFPLMMEQINAGKLSSGDVFGTRDFLKNNYAYRFLGAKLGIYGNSRDEAVYPPYFVDSRGVKLDASNANYELKFPKGQLPPAGAFWSLTMYDGKSQLLVDNPINRYLVNSTMLKSFKYAQDGSLTIYISNKNPGADKAANWLPAPSGPFYVMMRIYMPKPQVFNGQWVRPEIIKASN